MTPPKTAREVLEELHNYAYDKGANSGEGRDVKELVDEALADLAELVSVDSIEKELYLFNSKNQYTGFITTTRARTVYPIPHKRWMNPLAKTIHALITTKLGE